MGRFNQTIARIATALSAFLAYTWVLWPGSWEAFKEVNPEPLVLFLPLFATWIAAEFKFSEEVTLRASSPNDIRLAQRLLGYHREQFRVLLKNHDFHSSIKSRYVSEASHLIYESNTSRAFFQNKRVLLRYQSFVKQLGEFSNFIATHTVQSKFGREWYTSFLNKTQILSEEQYAAEVKNIAQANELATTSWTEFDLLISCILKEIPEAADANCEVKWFSLDSDSDSEE